MYADFIKREAGAEVDFNYQFLQANAASIGMELFIPKEAIKRAAEIAVLIIILRKSQVVDTVMFNELITIALFDNNGIREDILLKPGRLDYEEIETVISHPCEGRKIADLLKLNPMVIDAIGMHHERFDRAGYPKGCIPNILAQTINLLSQIAAISNPRPYNYGCVPIDIACVKLSNDSGIAYPGIFGKVLKPIYNYSLGNC